jgi:hypothetical protein
MYLAFRITLEIVYAPEEKKIVLSASASGK